MIQLPINMPTLAAYRESVDRAASAESLRAAAAVTSDSEALLGLSFFAKARDPVRKELSEMAVRARSEYAPVVALLAIIMDRIDAGSVGELVQRDPDNALGHYLQGTLLHHSDRESEALETFGKAAACSELRSYDSITGQALFKAIAALNLQGLDRLCALSWTTARWANFSSIGIQPIHWAIDELARSSDQAVRAELAEALIILAGHLFATNFINRWFAERAMQSAFALKAKLAAASNVPTMNSYVAALVALTREGLSWPGLEDWKNPSPLEVARFLPSRIHRAFAAADPALMNPGTLGETNLNPPESDRAAFDAAKARATETAGKLIDAALHDPDGVLGPYLKGLPQPSENRRSSPWALWSTPVEGLIQKRPDLIRAAAEHEQAMTAVWTVGQNDPSQRNIRRMMDIAWAILGYAQKHDGAFPDSFAVLFESGQPPFEAKSLRTGRPYVYTAASEKNPAKMNERTQFVLLYDDEPDRYGCYECGFAHCAGGHIRVADLHEQLRRRGK